MFLIKCMPQEYMYVQTYMNMQTLVLNINKGQRLKLRHPLQVWPSIQMVTSLNDVVGK